MTKRIYTSRTPVIEYQRCKRLRYLGNHAGSQHMGLQPVRKSIHLVLGGAVHAGLEVLLREGQRELDNVAKNMLPQGSLAEQLDVLFVSSRVDGEGTTFARNVENLAVAAALADLAEATKGGVELDAIEQAGQQGAGGNNDSGQVLRDSNSPSVHSGIRDGSGQDSPIMIDFGDFDASTGQFADKSVAVSAAAAELVHEMTLKDRLKASVAQPLPDDWSEPIIEQPQPKMMHISEVGMWPSTADDALLDSVQVDVARAQAADNQATGMDDYLREELAAQVEAMVRAYSRRRLRPLLAEFEVLEVEREGAWELARWQEWDYVTVTCVQKCGRWDGSSFDKQHPWPRTCPGCGGAVDVGDGAVELWFASRHDALLLERATGYLYLQSYKTTGSWDRRKEQDAAVDMQGLSEAVDVERRFQRAWELMHEPLFLSLLEDFSLEATLQMSGNKHILELVDERTATWLSTQAEPPKILGVRYEYLLKGTRRQDKKDLTAAGFARYVADTPLVRAWKQDGIAAEDRRWQPSYEWYELSGKSRRVDYRSWQKAAVWKYMPVAAWIDMLDSMEAWPDQYDEQGQQRDYLAEQFVPVVTVFRNEDDYRDWICQLEAQEEQVAVDVAAVQAVENDPVAYRNELNRRFQQNRSACVYPGKCAHYETCHGPYEIRRDPEGSGLFQVRVPNHPVEAQG